MVKSEKSNCHALDGDGISEVYFASNFCLKRVANEESSNDSYPNIQKYNPFIVVSATADVIDGHNGIWEEDNWEDEFSNWLFEFVNSMASQRDQGEKTYQSSDPDAQPLGQLDRPQVP